MSIPDSLIKDPEALFSLGNISPAQTARVTKIINDNPELGKLYLQHFIQKLQQFTTRSYHYFTTHFSFLLKVQTLYLRLNIVVREIIKQTRILWSLPLTFPVIHETENIITLLLHMAPYASLDPHFFNSEVTEHPAMVLEFYNKVNHSYNQFHVTLEGIFRDAIPGLQKYFYQTIDFYVSAAKIRTFFLYDLEKIVFPFGGNTPSFELASIRSLENEDDNHNELIYNAIPSIPPPYILIGALKIVLSYLFYSAHEDTVLQSVDLSLGIRPLNELDFPDVKPANLKNLDLFYAIKLLEVGYLPEIKALGHLAKDSDAHLMEFVVRKGVLFDPYLVKKILQACYVFLGLYSRLLTEKKIHKRHHDMFVTTIDVLWSIFEHCRRTTSQISQMFFDRLVGFLGQIMMQHKTPLPDTIRYKPVKLFVLWLEIPTIRPFFKNQETSIIEHGMLFFTRNRKAITNEDSQTFSIRWRFIIHHLLNSYPETLFILPLKNVRKYIQVSIKDFFYGVQILNTLKKKSLPLSSANQRSHSLCFADISNVTNSFLFLAKHNINFFIGYERILLDFIYNAMQILSSPARIFADAQRIAAALAMLIQHLDSVRFRMIAIFDHGDALKVAIQKMLTEFSISSELVAPFMNCLDTVTLDTPIPSQFLDPLSLVIIEDPVRLPLSSVVVDKKQICSYLKEKQVDPYTNTPISKQDLLIDIDSTFSIELSEFWKKLENKIVETF